VLEHEDSRVIKVRKFPLGTDGGALRAAGGEQIAVLGDQRAAPEGPQVACGADGCFVVWHASNGASSIALLDPAKKRVRWTRRFAPHAAHPAVAIAPNGAAAAAYFDAGLVRVARVDANGVGPASVVGKVAGDPPRASLVAGRAPGEWHVAWLGTEEGHAEPYAARVACRE
jgi:serine/threonine-protein kinase